ncbi:type II toxin-antitoxin system RelB/DinJ family antitoxin [Photorhabdus heterorhabditis]|uniref:Type II toxin-antitoxin system RelB/DinJ family antitoxin n=1 Tax=Photorhabdus heterorhabditis TaxID=880156 RepID=A0A5B0W9X6_9GAMM|nr:type II toxin-antitoxin system RelB/DinJ family antitoxin [Photorhabdus heterorhabditis]KAA1183175.1 type II toxin-antitoxin system RelB/DinJ family antitoxin [Photorhabdus heterorhabditis]MBS9443883.1 type II toxin-antitoxin system RelB/DinJ family antitoxin [Photorhabdus heterorhabditis]
MATIKTEIVKARVEPKLKEDAENVLSELGISLSDAIRIFLNQISLGQEFPIELKIPNRTTLKAINAPVTDEVFTSADELSADN